MKFILAEKQDMTQRYGQDGRVIPVTKIVATGCVVTQLKTVSTDGYTAVQIGFGARKRLTKSLVGHAKGLGVFRYFREFRLPEAEAQHLKIGDVLAADMFTPGDLVSVTGTTKGRGFQGVVKRHNFGGQPATHGHKDQSRMPGTSGAGGVQHVRKGKRMGGRMGGEQKTVQNLEVIEVVAETNELFLKGAVPGYRTGLLLLTAPGEAKVMMPSTAPAAEVDTTTASEAPVVETTTTNETATV